MEPKEEIEYLRAAVRAAQNGQEAALKLAEERAERIAHWQGLVEASRRYAFLYGVLITLCILTIVGLLISLFIGTPVIQ